VGELIEQDAAHRGSEQLVEFRRQRIAASQLRRATPPLLHGATPLPSEYRTRQRSAPTGRQTWEQKAETSCCFLDPAGAAYRRMR
jgi:hypothetical protein